MLGRGLHGLLDEVRLSDEVLHPEQFLRTTRFFSDLQPRSASAGLMLDQTPTRVQTGLALDWPLLGTLRPGIAAGVGTSMWSLGCETLDRDLADWEAYRAYLPPLGIRHIRLQGGWGRTEREPGVYDFAWLDRIVDDALSLGLTVCLETSYGNRLYQPNAGLGPGGPLPAGEETLAAWDRWVEAMVTRYSARGVHDWMMYNEPNLKTENTMDQVVDLNVRTAAILQRHDPAAKVAWQVTAGASPAYLQQIVDGVAALGQLDLFEALVYHGYSANPDAVYPNVRKIQAMLADSRAEAYAAKCMVMETARAKDRGDNVSTEAACCKMFASEMVGRVADRAVQIHGGAGYMEEYGIERIYRDVRLFRIYEGTSQVQQVIIARNMLKDLG